MESPSDLDGSITRILFRNDPRCYCAKRKKTKKAREHRNWLKLLSRACERELTWAEHEIYIDMEPFHEKAWCCEKGDVDQAVTRHVHNPDCGLLNAYLATTSIVIITITNRMEYLCQPHHGIARTFEVSLQPPPDPCFAISAIRVPPRSSRGFRTGHGPFVDRQPRCASEAERTWAPREKSVRPRRVTS